MAKSSKKKPAAKKPDSPVGKPQVKQGSAPAVQGKILLSWRVHPLMQQKRKGLILTLSSLGFLALIASSYEFAYVVVSAVMIIGAFGSFVLPSNYILTDQGIRFQNGMNNLERKWSAFGRYQVYPDGIQLLYKGKGLRERVLRGIFVYYGDQPDKVKEIIKEQMTPKEEPQE